MGIEGETTEESFEHKILKAKMIAEIAIMKLSLGPEAVDDEKFKWIEENSDSFRNFFDLRKQDEDFLKRCIENPDSIFEEYQSYKNELSSEIIPPKAA